MRDRLTIVFGILVLLPVILLAILGVKIARDERTMVAERVEALREDRLQGLAADVRRTVETIEAELAAALDEQAERDHEALRDLVRTQPLVTHVFALSPRGDLRFPIETAATEAERVFLSRTQAIWRGRAILYDPPLDEASTRSANRRDSISGFAQRRAQGWVTWYWAEGLHLLFWRAQPSGEVLGVEVDRVGLLARIVGVLPDLAVDDGRVVLTDARGDTVFQWGAAEPKNGERAAVRRALDYPLESFGVSDYPATAAVLGGGVQLGMYASIVAVIGAMGILALYFHRERTRELREASQRVGFVTQVSHELKTPLTNIRLYAELLGEELDDEDRGPVRRHLDVIVSESQRLSRLIHNILTFSKHTHDRLELRPRPLAVRPLVESVIAQFEPSFAAKGLTARVVGEATLSLTADADALGQVLGNLLSNVEKYAADGKHVDVELSQDATSTRIAVRDHGAGIPGAQRQRIFEPFVRLGHRLSDEAGTGIGLTIARELVRLHGGELSVEDASPGARFVLTLPNSPTASRGPPP